MTMTMTTSSTLIREGRRVQWRNKIRNWALHFSSFLFFSFLFSSFLFFSFLFFPFFLSSICLSVYLSIFLKNLFTYSFTRLLSSCNLSVPSDSSPTHSIFSIRRYSSTFARITPQSEWIRKSHIPWKWHEISTVDEEHKSESETLSPLHSWWVDHSGWCWLQRWHTSRGHSLRLQWNVRGQLGEFILSCVLISCGSTQILLIFRLVYIADSLYCVTHSTTQQTTPTHRYFFWYEGYRSDHITSLAIYQLQLQLQLQV